MNINYEALNMKINELTKYVSNVEFKLQNPSYVDIDYKNDIKADYFADDIASSRFEFYTTTVHKKINLCHESVLIHHHITSDSQLTVRDTYTLTLPLLASDLVAELTQANARLVEEN